MTDADTPIPTRPEPPMPAEKERMSSLAFATTVMSRAASTWAESPMNARVSLLITVTSAPGVTATVPAIDTAPAIPR